MPHAKWLKKLPNRLTFLRILCIPLLVFFMTNGTEVVSPALWPQSPPVFVDILAACVFGLAALTDFFDGWIARRYKIETTLGKLLDPLADKLLVVAALIILVEAHKLWGWVAVVLIVRDLGINAIRLAALDDGIDIPSSSFGKGKTLFLDIGIVFLILYGKFFYLPCAFLGNISMAIALLLSVSSAFAYLWNYGRQLQKK